jgi:hypothetical protein
MRDIFTMLMEGPKTAVAVSLSTATTGGLQWFDLIPDDIGKLASFVGVVLTIVLIVNHIRRGNLEVRKLRAELRRLEIETT